MAIRAPVIVSHTNVDAFCSVRDEMNTIVLSLAEADFVGLRLAAKTENDLRRLPT